MYFVIMELFWNIQLWLKDKNWVSDCCKFLKVYKESLGILKYFPLSESE